MKRQFLAVTAAVFLPGMLCGQPTADKVTAFARLRTAYGENYVYAGLGTTVELN